MEYVPKDSLLEFNPNTLQYLRRQYDLDTPGRIDEAIDILEEWIKKQNHFVVKKFPRDYLERSIIMSKGSVERAKKKLDKICTFRTLHPDFFGVCDVKNTPLLDDLFGVFLPKLTIDQYRVYILKNRAKAFTTGFLDFYRYFFMQCEYIQFNDYCNGVIFVLDYSEANIIETVKWLDLVSLRHFNNIIMEGYAMRIKGIHVISASRAIDTIIMIFKQVMSAKVAGRITIHKNLNDVLEYIDKDIMPAEFGGNERTVDELHEMNKEALTSEKFTAYLKEISNTKTDENLRISTGKTTNHDLGLPGTFRSLSVD